MAPPAAMDYKDSLQTMKTPTLIVFGERDPLKQRLLPLLEKIPNHQTVIIPRGSHPCYLDNPQIWHSSLISFLNRIRE